MTVDNKFEPLAKNDFGLFSIRSIPEALLKSFEEKMSSETQTENLVRSNEYQFLPSQTMLSSSVCETTEMKTGRESQSKCETPDAKLPDLPLTNLNIPVDKIFSSFSFSQDKNKCFSDMNIKPEFANFKKTKVIHSKRRETFFKTNIIQKRKNQVCLVHRATLLELTNKKKINDTVSQYLHLREKIADAQLIWMDLEQITQQLEANETSLFALLTKNLLANYGKAEKDCMNYFPYLSIIDKNVDEFHFKHNSSEKNNRPQLCKESNFNIYNYNQQLQDTNRNILEKFTSLPNEQYNIDLNYELFESNNESENELNNKNQEPDNGIYNSFLDDKHDSILVDTKSGIQTPLAKKEIFISNDFDKDLPVSIYSHLNESSFQSQTDIMFSNTLIFNGQERTRSLKKINATESNLDYWMNRLNIAAEPKLAKIKQDEYTASDHRSDNGNRTIAEDANHSQNLFRSEIPKPQIPVTCSKRVDRVIQPAFFNSEIFSQNNFVAQELEKLTDNKHNSALASFSNSKMTSYKVSNYLNNVVSHVKQVNPNLVQLTSSPLTSSLLDYQYNI